MLIVVLPQWFTKLILSLGADILCGCQFMFLMLHFQFSFVLWPGKLEGNGSILGLCIQERHLQDAPGSRLWIHSAVAVESIWVVNQQMGDLSLLFYKPPSKLNKLVLLNASFIIRLWIKPKPLAVPSEVRISLSYIGVLLLLWSFFPTLILIFAHTCRASISAVSVCLFTAMYFLYYMSYATPPPAIFEVLLGGGM